MKKLSFFLMAMLFSVMSFAQDAAYKTALFGASYNSKKISSYTDTWTATNDGFTVTIVNANNNNNGWNYIKMGRKNNASVGSITTKEAIDKPVSAVTLTIDAITANKINSLTLKTSTDGTTYTEAGTFSKAKGDQTVELTAPAANLYYQIVADCASGSSNGLITISKVQYFASEGGEQGPTVAAPVFDVTEPAFKEAFTLTITSEEGTTLKYTTDNTDPITSATAIEVATNTATVAIPAKSTVVKAVAIKDELTSKVKSVTYGFVNTPETAYTVSEAIDVINAGLGLDNELYAKGEIYKIDSYNSTYKSITYWIKDEAGKQLQVYSGRGLNNTDFASKDDLVIGTKVVICGLLKKFNSTYEFDKTNYIVSLELPVINHTITVSANPAENGTVEGAGEYEEGKEATLTATANEGYEFTCWTVGEDTVSTENPYTFVVTANVALVANFKEAVAVVTKEEKTTCVPGTLADGKVTHDLPCCVIVQEQGESTTALKSVAPWEVPAKSIMTITPKEGVTILKYVINAKTTTLGTYLGKSELTNATKTATNNGLVTFTVTNGTEPVVMKFVSVTNKFHDITFTYTVVGGTEPVKYTVTVKAENGTVEGAGEYEEGAEATLTATANEGYEFTCWTVGEDTVSTENPYKFNVTADVEVVANFQEAAVVEPTTETVYFINNKSWSKVNAYAWDPTQNAGWPGKAATKEAEQVAGYDVYSYTAEVGAHKNVIFNNGSAQTADLKWTAGKYYWMGNAKNFAGATKEEAEAALAKPIEYESVYFVDNQGWGKANIYTWSPEVGTWPGVAMKKEAEQLAGFNVYSYTVEKGTSFGGMLFNNGSKQTKDLQWTAGKYYVKDAWYTKEEAIEKLSAPVTPPVITYVLMGVKGDWKTGIAMTQNPDNANEYVLLGQEILEGDSVKVVTLTDGVATAWCGNVDEYSPVEYTNAEGNGNIVLAPGKYDFYYKVTEDLIYIGGEAYKPEIEWEEIGLEITNLTTEVMEVEGKKYLQLNGRNDMMDADVNLFLNDYADVDDDYEVNAESSYMTFGGLELTVIEGVMTQTSETDKGTIYTGTVYASVTDEEEGGTMYVKFALTMYAAPATVLELADAIVAINEELGTLTFNVPTGEGEGYYVELAGYTAPGVHEGPQICLLETPEVVAYTNYAETSVADGVITLKGEFTSFMGDKFDLTISGKLPVEEPVEKPEPTYTENNLNPYAFGLESKLSDDKTTLTVTYRLNNSNATSVNVLVYNGEDIVASVPGTTTIGKNTVEVATGNLPAGVELKWAVEVNGTSVEAPTQETKMYNLYCPHGLAIDTDPESENFGRILVADAMNVVKDKTGYLGSGIGAGLHAFNPSFTTDSTVYTGGNDFTRILTDNGYQPWRVKISEDGRIFVSSLDLNGVVVWEVSKDLQTWTPVIAGTNDATDYNIYDAEGNFIAGPNCSMDVIGSGEDLKLLLYSTNNKGIAFNQSGYRLDEYALGTATTWTGTPKNILEGGKLGVVHTNVEFIYDGEGGYWFGGSRAGNAGQPNLVHINAAGEQDYYTEDAGLYGGDGVLVHNGMLFKGKARTSGTVGNFGVWTIGKDADGKVTLTEKWSVVADGIGRNLNEFAVDYAENLYVVGNSGEKIIAYALPYSGKVETPAAAKYAFQLPEPLKMVGTVKRAVQNGDQVIVLTHEENGAAHIYQVVDGKAIAEVSQEGVVPVDTENPGSYLAISDIAVTEDGKLVANNYVRNQFAGTTPEAGYKLGTSYYYIWNDLAGAPAVWFTSQTTARSSHGDVGVTFALKGTSTNAELLVTAVHNNNRAVRLAKYNVIDGQYVEPNIPGGEQDNAHYQYFGTHTKEAYYQEAVQGKQFQLNVSPLGEGRWIMDGELVNPSEFVLPAVGENYEASATLTEDLGKKYQGATYVTVGEKVLMVAPFANPDGQLVGAEILDITKGLDAPQYVDMVYVDEAVAATAAATAVEVVEGGLNITLVADAAIHTWFVELSEGPEYQVYEDAITNLVIDYDNLLLIGGPSDAFQVEVVLGLGDFDRNTGAYQLLPASTISVMGSEATFIDGVASVDGIEQSATAVVHCTWNGMAIEFHLTMTSAPMEATKVVVENATVEIEKVLLFGDMYDYALKMTGVWHNEEDGLDYPVLVEVPVYYPEATEPSTIFSTVTVGGWGDEDPWLGFGEGDLTITTVDNVITATGIVQNPMAGVAIDITISGSTLTDDLENTTVTLKTVKMIQNGQLIIKKGDAQFNAQGATVK